MKNLRLLASLPVVIFTLLTACSKDAEVEVYPTQEDVILEDVAYGSHPQQRMDVYLPANRNAGQTRILVFIHGGGWSGGDKGDLDLNEALARALKENFPGFALFNLNYRLVIGDENQYPAAEEDIQTAMQYIYGNLESYQVSGETYMAGGSAGAHLAALHTLKHNTGNRIKGCIGISGVYDLKRLYDNGGDEAKLYVSHFMGGSPSDIPEQYEQASPVRFITEGSPKFLILHGLEDQLVPVSQAQELKSALDDKGVENTIFTYSGGHGIPPQHLEAAFGYISDFLGI